MDISHAKQVTEENIPNNRSIAKLFCSSVFIVPFKLEVSSDTVLLFAFPTGQLKRISFLSIPGRLYKQIVNFLNKTEISIPISNYIILRYAPATP